MQKADLSNLGTVHLMNTETGEQIPLDGITTISDNEITVSEKTPSRTYIEMYVETGRYNYLLKDRLHYINLLRDVYQYLCDHPEIIEDIVKERVRVGKFAKMHNSLEWLFLELQVVNSWMMAETFSGDTMYTVPVKSDYFVPEIRINNTNPIYIPKHIQHRKKGRK